jgi:hypothetical protein
MTTDDKKTPPVPGVPIKAAADEKKKVAQPKVAKGAEVMVRHMLPGPVHSVVKGKVEAVNEDGSLEISVPSPMAKKDGRAILSDVKFRDPALENAKVKPAPVWWEVAEEPHAKK